MLENASGSSYSVEKVLLRDLPSLYGISDIQELNKLFLHIAFRSGNEFSYETLSSEAGIKKIQSGNIWNIWNIWKLHS